MTEKQHTFRKKPIDIQAFQMTRDRRDNRGDWPAWLVEASNKNRTEPGALFIAPTVYDEPYFKINTLEGEHTVTWNDWIVQGVKGEVYPIKPDIFAESYFAVNANPIASQPAEKLDLAKFEGCTPRPWIRQRPWIRHKRNGLVITTETGDKIAIAQSSTIGPAAWINAELMKHAPDLLAEVRESRETIAKLRQQVEQLQKDRSQLIDLHNNTVWENQTLKDTIRNRDGKLGILRQQVEEMREGMEAMVDDYVNQHGHHDQRMCFEDRGGCPYCEAAAILAKHEKEEGGDD